MQTTRRWAAACSALSLLPLLFASVVLGGLRSTILVTYELAYKGRPLPLAISDFVASPTIPWILLAVPFAWVGIFLLKKHRTVEGVVLLALANLAYTLTLLIAYAAAGFGIILAWSALPLSSP